MQIKDASFISPAGDLSSGGLVTHLTDSNTAILSFTETLDFLDAQVDRSCVPVPGLPVCADTQIGNPITLSARGAAIALSSADFQILITEIETMCRQAGSSCTYQTQAIIAAMKRHLHATQSF